MPSEFTSHLNKEGEIKDVYLLCVGNSAIPEPLGANVPDPSPQVD